MSNSRPDAFMELFKLLDPKDFTINADYSTKQSEAIWQVLQSAVGIPREKMKPLDESDKKPDNGWDK